MLATRRLGLQGLEVASLGLGCMGMSQSYGPGDEGESVATIHRAVDLGVTLFDTAEVYGPYVNEELLGRALEGRRDGVVIATKFGFRIEGNDRFGVDSRPEHIRAVAEASLPPGFNGVLPRGWIDNRPFLRCLHGLALCAWRQRRWDDAAAMFEARLWLDPSGSLDTIACLDQAVRNETIYSIKIVHHCISGGCKIKRKNNPKTPRATSRCAI